jgi:DNA replication and repair protein RecF
MARLCEELRSTEFNAAHPNVVMFAREDLELVKGSPGKRRRFLDMEIGQTSPAYLYELGRYHKLLSQRNTLLKDWSRRRENRPMVEVFTDQLIAVAAQIIYKRIGFVQVLKERAKPIHEQITAGKETLAIVYAPSVPVEENMTVMHISTLLTDQFRQIVEQEERRGTTLIGPHRDDLEFYVNDRSVHTFGSQGQQRTTALAVKLAEIELIQQEVGEYPILLLDDVLSELDDHRRSHLLQAIQHKVQTFVTNTSLEGIDPVTLRESFVYDVREGRITVRRGE